MPISRAAWEQTSFSGKSNVESINKDTSKDEDDKSEQVFSLGKGKRLRTSIYAEGARKANDQSSPYTYGSVSAALEKDL